MLEDGRQQRDLVHVRDVALARHRRRHRPVFARTVFLAIAHDDSLSMCLGGLAGTTPDCHAADDRGRARGGSTSTAANRR